MILLEYSGFSLHFLRIEGIEPMRCGSLGAMVKWWLNRDVQCLSKAILQPHFKEHGFSFTELIPIRTSTLWFSRYKIKPWQLILVVDFSFFSASFSLTPIYPSILHPSIHANLIQYIPTRLEHSKCPSLPNHTSNCRSALPCCKTRAPRTLRLFSAWTPTMR
jgi:hypothetical protein